MKTFLVLILVCMTSTLMAASNELGLGVILGNPTGLSGKYWLDDNAAVDGAFALSLGKNTNLSLHSDYLLHKKSAFFLNDVHPLDLYFGAGGRLEFDDSVEIGIRLPVGLAHRLADQPADVFAEVAPIVDFVGRTGLEMHFAIGGRYYF
jgi:hypothetical protein